MNNVVFLFESFNPNKKTTFFKHKNYTNYLAYSEYAIRNKNTNHGLFGKIEGFQNIQEMENIEPINRHIINLAENKIPIYRCTISLDEYDAVRFGYDTQDKWKEMFDSKLVSLAKKMNIKYEDIQYTGAVHLESGHPHLQVMVWSKQRDKMNYYIDYNRINEMRHEYTNVIFKEELIELYKEKDIAKKGIIEKNQLLQKLKNVSSDPKFMKDMLQYEKDFSNKKLIKRTLKDEELKQIAKDLLLLKAELKNTQGSIKYQYLKKYPNIIKRVNDISNKIIEMSIDCKHEKSNYILAKQKIVAFKYQDNKRIQKAQQEEKEKAEIEILKIIGNQVLNLERILLNEHEEYSQARYVNYSRDLIWEIFNCIYFSTRQQEKYIRKFEVKYKKNLSKQAKKELAIRKKNSSYLNWQNEQ